MRKVLFAAALLAAFAAGHGPAGAPRADAGDDKAAAKDAAYVHVVIFYLKKDAPKDAADGLIKDAHELLTKIPSVRGLRVGRPADKATPNFARKDYDVGLVVFFDDADGLEAYLKHPMHDKYVERHLKHIDEKKLTVFDFVQKK